MVFNSRSDLLYILKQYLKKFGSTFEHFLDADWMPTLTRQYGDIFGTRIQLNETELFIIMNTFVLLKQQAKD